MTGSLPEPAADMEFLEVSKRNLSEVANIIRQLLTEKFELVEQKYAQLEAYNSGRITQDMLHHLLKQ